MQFRYFILNETRSALGHKLGDILTALQSLSDDAPNMGSRQLLRAAKGVVNEIRRVLHDTWSDTESSTLKTLQRIGVALMKSIEENQPIGEVLSTAVQELQKSQEELGEPVNNLASPEPEARPENQS